METQGPALENTPLGSMWDGLSPYLIASFYPVRRVANSRFWEAIPDTPSVRAPLTECGLDVLLGWQSSLESSGQNVLPTMKAMLSSGVIDLPDGKASNFIGGFEGRTGATKLNSTQVFIGMQPLKFRVTAIFRAWRDPVQEVEKPIQQLMKWALPVDLAEDGAVVSLLKKPLGRTVQEIILPSVAPVKIAMRYKGKTYMPLVIESISLPLDSPIDANGNHVEMPVSIMLCSLAAIDGKDWSGTGSGQGFSA